MIRSWQLNRKYSMSKSLSGVHYYVNSASKHFPVIFVPGRNEQNNPIEINNTYAQSIALILPCTSIEIETYQPFLFGASNFRS